MLLYMSRQSQKQQQKIIINLAPKPQRKKRKKKKSKSSNSLGDFRTALARSVFIQRGSGGLGFNQAPPFRRNIDANAEKLNARSRFEGIRTERPTLRSEAQTQTDPNPVDTATGSVRGDRYIPRILSETFNTPSSNISSISLLSRKTLVEESEIESLFDLKSPSKIALSNIVSETSDKSIENTLTEEKEEEGEISSESKYLSPYQLRPRKNRPNLDDTKRIRNKEEVFEGIYMGLEDKRLREGAYTQTTGLLGATPQARKRIIQQRTKQANDLDNAISQRLEEQVGSVITEDKNEKTNLIFEDAETE